MLLKGKNVLIIEDNENDMKIAESHLKSLKAKVFKCETGEKALETFKKRDIDLVIVDYRLPYKNGLMITNEIKSIREVPIILITGIDEVIHDVDYVKKFGFDDVICKPYHKVDFVNSIENIKGVTPVHRTNLQWLYLSALLILLISVSSIIYFQPHKDIFKEYYTSENIMDQTRGDGDIVDGVIKFHNKDYKSATQYFSKIIQKDSSNITIWFYYGISNIEIRDFNKAIESFNYIINENDNLYIEHAEWYLALCYLKNNQKDKAIDQFTKISKNFDNYHQNEAIKILKELK